MESESARPLQAGMLTLEGKITNFLSLDFKFLQKIKIFSDMRAQVTDPLKRKIERLEFFLEHAIEKINALTENYENDAEEQKAAISNLADQIERAR